MVILYVWTVVFASAAAAAVVFPTSWVVLGTVVGVAVAIFLSVVHLPVRTSSGWRRLPTARASAGRDDEMMPR